MNFKFILIISAFFVLSNGIAQERLIDLYENVVLQNVQEQEPIKRNVDALELPFFDDFSGTNVYPDPSLWTDNYAYINNGYCIGQPTYGVATLDAVSGDGTHYENASSSPFSADSLTSQIINLQSADMESLYLSFYYQPQGNGNEPETNDSLLLQLKDTSGGWNTVWFSTGESYLDFRKNKLGLSDDVNDTVIFLLVNIPINDGGYIFDSFQFRFVNYASISGAGHPSRATNCDHWNIDYVYLNDGRSENDIVFEDIAFVEAPALFMRTYKSVPWSHYPSIIETVLTSMQLHLRNNNNKKMSVSPARLYFKDMNSSWNDSITMGTKDINAFSNNKSFIWPFSGSGPIPHSGTKGDFIIEAKIFPSETDPKVNNTVSYEQHFDNYYAYDDGTAEKIYGHNTNGGLVAYKFNAGKADTLRGAYMYFLRNNPQEEAAESFIFCVWDDDSGEPGAIRVKTVGRELDFGDELNDFVRISLDTSILVEGTYYIGWQQVSDDYLNVGFDKNNNQKDKIFYNLFGTWENTSFLGSLMIRPIFGDPIPSSINEIEFVQEFKIYPNPTRQLFNIEIDGLQMAIDVQIYNLMGEMVLQEKNYGHSIDVSTLSQGIYFVNIDNGDQQYKAQRLVISD